MRLAIRRQGPLTRILIIAATALFAVAGLSGVGTASVTATCYGDACGGKDPNATGCSAGAQTLAEFIMLGFGAHQYRVEMRYSSVCHASWTRLSNVGNPDCTFPATAWHWAYQNGTGISNFSKEISVGPACSAHTVMMSKVGRVNRACGYSTWDAREYCTAPK
jgi:hypothetical protein